MNISEPFIRRPVMTTLVMLAIEYGLLKPLEARVTSWRRAVAI